MLLPKVDPRVKVLDAYGAHVKFVEANKLDYEARNVHFAIILPNMTGLLQPLDVAINRSFQQLYENSNCLF